MQEKVWDHRSAQRVEAVNVYEVEYWIGF